jgi:hypothetical protein
VHFQLQQQQTIVFTNFSSTQLKLSVPFPEGYDDDVSASTANFSLKENSEASSECTLQLEQQQTMVFNNLSVPFSEGYNDDPMSQCDFDDVVLTSTTSFSVKENRETSRECFLQPKQ